MLASHAPAKRPIMFVSKASFCEYRGVRLERASLRTIPRTAEVTVHDEFADGIAVSPEGDICQHLVKGLQFCTSRLDINHSAVLVQTPVVKVDMNFWDHNKRSFACRWRKLFEISEKQHVHAAEAIT